MQMASGIRFKVFYHQVARDLWYFRGSHRDEGFLRKVLLSPLWLLSLLYRCVVGLRVFLYKKGILRSRALSCRVLCVGNITVGGTGKTPLVMTIARLLKEEGLRVGIVSRGYARNSRGCAIVSDGKEILLPPEDAGDEPFLLARKLSGVPVVVGGNPWMSSSSTMGSLISGFSGTWMSSCLRGEQASAMGISSPGGPFGNPSGA